MQERDFRLLGLMGVSDGPHWVLLRSPLTTVLRLQPLRGSGGARTPLATPGRDPPFSFLMMVEAPKGQRSSLSFSSTSQLHLLQNQAATGASEEIL